MLTYCQGLVVRIVKVHAARSKKAIEHGMFQQKIFRLATSLRQLPLKYNDTRASTPCYSLYKFKIG